MVRKKAVEKKKLKPKKKTVDRRKEYEENDVSIDRKVRRLVRWLEDAETTLVYTGAGISTAANIPDYRGPNGVWTLAQQGKEIVRCGNIISTEPTSSHMILKELYRQKYVNHVLSQNCDGLHLRSGLPQTALSEIHGNMNIEVCSHCERQYVRPYDVTGKSKLRNHGTGRFCDSCSYELHDTIVHFGECGRVKWPLNWDGTRPLVPKADLIICVGTSLAVLKAYNELWPEKGSNTKVVIVNLQWTVKDNIANLKIHSKCDKFFQKLAYYLDLDIKPYCRDCDPVLNPRRPTKRADIIRYVTDCMCHIKPPRTSVANVAPELATEGSDMPGWWAVGLKMQRKDVKQTKRPGRPRKVRKESDAQAVEAVVAQLLDALDPLPKRRRGRPRKAKKSVVDSEESSESEETNEGNEEEEESEDDEQPQSSATCKASPDLISRLAFDSGAPLSDSSAEDSDSDTEFKISKQQLSAGAARPSWLSTRRRSSTDNLLDGLPAKRRGRKRKVDVKSEAESEDSRSEKKANVNDVYPTEMKPIKEEDSTERSTELEKLVGQSSEDTDVSVDRRAKEEAVNNCIVLEEPVPHQAMSLMVSAPVPTEQSTNSTYNTTPAFNRFSSEQVVISPVHGQQSSGVSPQITYNPCSTQMSVHCVPGTSLAESTISTVSSGPSVEVNQTSPHCETTTPVQYPSGDSLSIDPEQSVREFVSSSVSVGEYVSMKLKLSQKNGNSPVKLTLPICTPPLCQPQKSVPPAPQHTAVCIAPQQTNKVDVQQVAAPATVHPAGTRAQPVYVVGRPQTSSTTVVIVRSAANPLQNSAPVSQSVACPRNDFIVAPNQNSTNPQHCKGTNQSIQPRPSTVHRRTKVSLEDLPSADIPVGEALRYLSGGNLSAASWQKIQRGTYKPIGTPPPMNSAPPVHPGAPPPFCARPTANTSPPVNTSSPFVAAQPLTSLSVSTAPQFVVANGTPPPMRSAPSVHPGAPPPFCARPTANISPPVNTSSPFVAAQPLTSLSVTAAPQFVVATHFASTSQFCATPGSAFPPPTSTILATQTSSFPVVHTMSTTPSANPASSILQTTTISEVTPLMVTSTFSVPPVIISSPPLFRYHPAVTAALPETAVSPVGPVRPASAITSFCSAPTVGATIGECSAAPVAAKPSEIQVVQNTQYSPSSSSIPRPSCSRPNELSSAPMSLNGLISPQRQTQVAADGIPIIRGNNSSNGLISPPRQPQVAPDDIPIIRGNNSRQEIRRRGQVRRSAASPPAVVPGSEGGVPLLHPVVSPAVSVQQPPVLQQHRAPLERAANEPLEDYLARALPPDVLARIDRIETPRLVSPPRFIDDNCLEFVQLTEEAYHLVMRFKGDRADNSENERPSHRASAFYTPYPPR